MTYTGENGQQLLLREDLALFIIRKGRRFFPPGPLPKGMRKRKVGNCFMNAGQYMFRFPGYEYCEGAVWTGTGCPPILHGWLYRVADGEIIDPTFGPVNWNYLGFRIPVEVVGEIGKQAGRWGVFANMPPEGKKDILKQIRKHNARERL